MRMTLLRSLLLGAAILGVASAADARQTIVGPHGNPIDALPKATGTRYVLGVMGGAGKSVPKRVTAALNELGDEIGKRRHVTLTGACPGFPHVVLKAAKAAGGLTVGISGHPTLAKHIARGAPVDDIDVLQLTTLPHALRNGTDRPNYMGRELDNIERSNALLFVGGRSGTLGEFSIAYDEGRTIGVLKGSGGISDELEHLVKVISKNGKPPRAPVIFDSNPRRLVKRVVKALDEKPAGGVRWDG
jgi:uncharacterized protein (TIGR00725 family)